MVMLVVMRVLMSVLVAELFHSLKGPSVDRQAACARAGAQYPKMLQAYVTLHGFVTGGAFLVEFIAPAVTPFGRLARFSP